MLIPGRFAATLGAEILAPPVSRSRRPAMFRAPGFRLVVLLVVWAATARLALGDGAPTLATTAPADASVSAVVAGDVNFELDVMPVLTAAGCNAGACHGKSRGQNGFQLSLLGFDPDFDFATITQHAHGRRVFPAAPENSLLLRKASLRLPHGGGERLKRDSAAYETLRRWIAAGMPRAGTDAPTLARISLEPPEHVMSAGQSEQLRVLAHYSDGSIRNVAALSDFQSNEAAVVSVDHGLVKAGPRAGEATLMVRYMNKIATWNTAIPQSSGVDSELYAQLPRKNFIDGHVWDKLERLGILPSEPASDATFLRRAYLDVIGRLPTPDEARAFLDELGPLETRGTDRRLARPARVRRLLGQQVGRPAAAQSVSRRHQADLRLRRLDSRRIPAEHAVRPVCARVGHGRRAARGATARRRCFAIAARRTKSRPSSASSFSASGWNAPSAITIRSKSGARTTSTAWPPTLPASAHKGEGISSPISGGEEIVFVADSRLGDASDHSESARAAPAVRQGPRDRAGRRSARSTGRMDHVGRQPVFRPGDRQSRVGRPDGPRPGRAGG